METLVTNLVKNGNGRVRGAAVAFLPDYYPQKGRWYEPYAQWDDGNKNQLFGRKRVVQLLTGCANKTPKEVVDTIITEVKQYAGNMEQSDDLTLLASDVLTQITWCYPL